MTAHGLYQWDYGRQLQIRAEGLPALAEVHFACIGMSEAVVRVMPVEGGVGVVTIPDKCLEQTTPITAWVCITDETSSKTWLEITLPITPRTKPMDVVMPDVIQENRYNELFAAVENALGDLDDTVQSAKNAATLAGAALTAANATQGKAEAAQGKAEAAQEAAEGAYSSTMLLNAAASTAKTKAEAAQKAAEEAAARAEDAAEGISYAILRGDEEDFVGKDDASGVSIYCREGEGQLFHVRVESLNWGVISVGLIYWEPYTTVYSQLFVHRTERCLICITTAEGAQTGFMVGDVMYRKGIVKIHKVSAANISEAFQTGDTIVVKPLNPTPRL